MRDHPRPDERPVDHASGDMTYGTPEMIRQCAAECLDLAAMFSSAAAERLRDDDLPGYRCAMRCAAAANKCARELAALLGDEAGLGRADRVPERRVSEGGPPR